MFNKALRLFDNHLGYLHMACGWLVEGTRDDFAAHRTLHFGYFFWALIDQQYDEAAFRIIARNRLRDVLKNKRLTRLRWRHDKSALAFADWCDEVDDSRTEIFGAAITHLQSEAVLGE